MLRQPSARNRSFQFAIAERFPILALQDRLRKFDCNMAYLRTHDGTSASPAPIEAGVIYTCPMHPQIRRAGPGRCPICGMTLEPVTPSADVGENRELADMTRRFWVGLVLALPVFCLEMGGHIPALGLHDLVPPRISS